MWRENLFNHPSNTKLCEVHHFYSPVQIEIRLQVWIDLGLVRYKSIIQSPPAERKGWKVDGQGGGGKATTDKGAPALWAPKNLEAARPQ